MDEGDSVKTNPDVSRELGRRWRDLSPQQKEYWNKLAEEEKKNHAEKYPGYRYIPRRFGKKNKCPTCKSRAHMKEIDAHEQRLRILDLQEEEIKSRLAAHQVSPSVQSSSPSPNTTDHSTKLYNSASSEEHAIAQSFLNLRNQPHNYFPQQPQHYQPQSQHYYSPTSQIPKQQLYPLYSHVQNVQQSSTMNDRRSSLSSQNSQSDKYKAGSIASIMN